MNGIKYVQLLKEKLKLHVHVHGCTIFTQDGAPCHRLKVATEFRKKNEISVLECHGNSPDSSPVENVWIIMKDKVAYRGAGRSSEVERSLMVRWVVGSILHGVDPLSYFSFQPVLHDWCNKGMCYPVCWDGAYKRNLAVNR